MLTMAQKGLDKLIRLTQKLRLLPVFVGREVGRIMLQEADALALLNVAQLNKGIDSQEKPLRYKKKRLTPANSAGTYSANYARRKAGLGGRTDIVDLKNTGKFHGSITLNQTSPNTFEFVSDEDAAKFLVDNYGTDLFGVSENNLNNFVNKVLNPKLNIRVEQFLTM